MDFVHNKLYKFKNKKFGTAFVGRLGKSKYLTYKPYLTGKDQNNSKCHLPIAAINDINSGWELIEEIK